MYRNRNLDIAIATIIAVLGGLAAAKQLPGQITIPLGIGLFFAPGYLWSEAILNQWLPGVERALTSVGMALIFPILGGFLFYGLHIPLFRSSWIGLLVVLTLLGVVAVAVQRLRQPPAVRRPPRPVNQQSPRRGDQPPPRRARVDRAQLIHLRPGRPDRHRRRRVFRQERGSPEVPRLHNSVDDASRR